MMFLGGQILLFGVAFLLEMESISPWRLVIWRLTSYEIILKFCWEVIHWKLVAKDADGSGKITKRTCHLTKFSALRWRWLWTNHSNLHSWRQRKNFEKITYSKLLMGISLGFASWLSWHCSGTWFLPKISTEIWCWATGPNMWRTI